MPRKKKTQKASKRMNKNTAGAFTATRKKTQTRKKTKQKTTATKRKTTATKRKTTRTATKRRKR